MRIARATAEHAPRWAALRSALWPDQTPEEQAREIPGLLANPNLPAWLAFASPSEPVGFAEASLRRDYVNGCESSPVVFLEGIYVDPAHRRLGAARALVAAVAEWGRAQGCREFASDALLDNAASHAFHAQVGFAETERVVYFRQPL
jgi:aminoglycoside 6'-N-acetyltransferase I